MKKRSFKILALVSLFILGAAQVRADIDEWEFANPNDPSQGVIQLSTPCPGGSGVSAAPFALLGDLDLTKAYLTYAYLYSANLAGTNLTDANLVSAYLTDATLSNATLTDANLTNAYLYSTTLASANLTNANLTNAYLGSANLAGANLTGANLTNAYFLGTSLAGANLAGADLRGSQGLALGSATAVNAILPDGTMQGLHLDSNNPSLLVRNYGGNIPIHVLQGMSVNPGTALEFQLDGAAWGSTISFASAVPVTLDGTLDLDLAAGVEPAGLLGDSFHLFDWAGVSPSGRFAQIASDLPAGYTWDTAQLYTSGEVTLEATPEPATLSLLGIGAVALVGYGWRRRRQMRGLALAAEPTVIFDRDDRGRQADEPSILSLPSGWTQSARRAA